MKVRIKSTRKIKKEPITPRPLLIQESSGNTDWGQVRIQAAISAMQGLCNSCHDSVIREIQERSDMERSNVISYLSVRMADALINELKK